MASAKRTTITAKLGLQLENLDDGISQTLSYVLLRRCCS